MKTDAQIKEDVLDELSWQPNVDETQIGVIVDHGVVTLSGVVDNYSKKLAAERAVRNVSGVKAVAEDIEVKYGSDFKRTDGQIAKATTNAIEWNTSVPSDAVQVKVENGWVYLSGEVKWDYQKKAAKRAVEDILGVKGVSDSIIIKQAVKPFEIKEKIKKAFERTAIVDANAINVDVDGHTVKLKGKVHSLYEKEEARKTAFSAPGVYSVKDELEVEY